MNRKAVLTLLILGIILIAGCVQQANKNVTSMEDVQEKVNALLNQYPELNRDDYICNLADNGTEIALSCSPTGAVSDSYLPYNATHDKLVRQFFSMSAGSHGGELVDTKEYIIPHFNPIKKSTMLKLVKEGPVYHFDCKGNNILSPREADDYTGEEKRVPYTIMDAIKADEQYVKVTKERCLSYTTDQIRSKCLSCFVSHMETLIPNPMDVRYCDGLQQYSNLYERCVGNIASFSNNLNICKGRSSQELKDKCVMQVARGQRDEKICINVENLSERQNCIYYIREIVADVGPR